ncbi:MAG: thiamine-phosphate kinase [Bacteroidales bacterium]
MSEEGDNKQKKISELGEFGLIDHLTHKIELKHKSSLCGVGDDSAVINYGDLHTVVTTDLMLEGIHFDLMYFPLKHLGYKAVVVNISDILAMNCIPQQIIVSLGISGRFELGDIEKLYSGIQLACEKYNIDIIGGDTTTSLTGLTISITALGQGRQDRIVYRNGASKNDIICTTGNLGGAYMGLQLLEREKEVFKAHPDTQPDLSGYDYILERQLKPEARIDVIRFFEENNIVPTAMIDISDGLASDLLHICSLSDTGCKIFQDKIPIDNNTVKMADKFDIEPTTAALNGGQDYELLFTISTDDYSKIEHEERIHPIGHITDSDFGTYMISFSDHEIELKAQGWDKK